MLKILLWIVSDDTGLFNDTIRILERQHNGFELVGLTAEVPIHIANGGKSIPFVPLNEIEHVATEYEVLLVVGARQIGMSELVQTARQFHLPEEKILLDRIVCIPGFTLKKYRQLQRSRLSIFSLNCCGGLISSFLGLQFLSPFVNLFLGEEDFIKFLRAPRVYLECSPRFEKLTRTSREAPGGYPLFSLGDISLHMMHYKDPADALELWNARKQRINWDNLFVTMCTKDEKILAQFDALPYDKKACFVPFKSDSDSAYYINPKLEDSAFAEIVNHVCAGNPVIYDPFDMLLYGKKTQLIDM